MQIVALSLIDQTGQILYEKSEFIWYYKSIVKGTQIPTWKHAKLEARKQIWFEKSRV